MAQPSDAPLGWYVVEVDGGSVDANGRYTAPLMPGTFHVGVKQLLAPLVRAEAVVTVVAEPVAPVITTFPEVTTGRTRLKANVPVTAGLTYAWSGDGLGITGGADSAQAEYTAGPPGMATLRCTATNAAGDSVTTSVPITVHEEGLTLITGTLGGAGTTDGLGTAARFNNPTRITIGPDGNLYVVDGDQTVIRRVSPQGLVETFAGKSGVQGDVVGYRLDARFQSIAGLAVDAAGNLYVADSTVHVIRRIDAAGMVTTFAGAEGMYASTDGQGSQARFLGPGDITEHNGVLSTLEGTDLRRITLATAAVATSDLRFLVGGGSVFGALQTTDAATEALFVVVNSAILRSPPLGTNPFAGNESTTGYVDGFRTAARFGNPVIRPWSQGLLLLDSARVRTVTFAGTASTVAGGGPQTNPWGADGPLLSASFSNPRDVVEGSDGVLFVADSWCPCIRRIADGMVSVWAGAPARFVATRPAEEWLNNPLDIAALPGGDFLIVDNGSSVIRRVDSAGLTTDFAGVRGSPGFANGPLASAQFNGVSAVLLLEDGSLLVADTANAVIRKISAGQVETYAGAAGDARYADGERSEARFVAPFRMALDVDGSVLIVDGNAIRRVSTDGVETVAGDPTVTSSMNGPVGVATFNVPSGVAVGPGGRVFVAEAGNHVIRVIESGTVSDFAGIAGQPGGADGARGVAMLSSPFDVDVLPDGSLLVADNGNHRLRRITQDGETTTIAGSEDAIGVAPGPLPASLSGPIANAVLPNGDIAVLDRSEAAVLVLRVAY